MRKTAFIFCFIFLTSNIVLGEVDMFFKERENMIKAQIERRGVKDRRVLDAMLKVERHRFVPSEFTKMAYTDGPLPIGFDQTISQPYIVALMTELGNIKESDNVLEIGTGSGYQAAILGELAKEVYTIEIIPELAENAERSLKELGYENVFVKAGDGYLGWEEHAPYDIIIVTASPPEIPEKLVEQLKDGGRMVIPVGEEWRQVLRLLIKESGKIVEKDIIPVRFVPMVHER
ncbi:MAG: protein-L-isoaspartate(D-aspartate) O-methyltransferase [Candidatus Omnitrophota bacterium]